MVSLERVTVNIEHEENEEEEETKTSETPQTEGEEKEEDSLLFSCRCESTRSVATLLSCLRRVAVSSSNKFNRTSKNQPMIATVFVSSTALTFHVYGTGRQSQASVDMQASLFSDYHVRERRISIVEEGHDEASVQVVQGGEFAINLSTVIECLQLLGSSPSVLDRIKLCMSYDINTCIFQMELLEEVSAGGGSVFLTSAIPGMSVPDDEDDRGLAVAFRSSPIVARCILESHILQDAIHELFDVPGAVVATLGMSSQGLEIISVGNDRECHIALPNLPQIFVSMDCQPQENPSTTTNSSRSYNGRNNVVVHAQSYPLTNLLTSMKGLEIATETCISMNSRGMIAIQHQVLDKFIGNGQPNYVDFIMTCIEDEDEVGETMSGTTTFGDNQPNQTNPTSSNNSNHQPSLFLQSSNVHRKKTNEEEENMDTYSLGDEEKNKNDTDSETASSEGGGAEPAFSPQLLFGQLDTITSDNYKKKKTSSQKKKRQRRRYKSQEKVSQQTAASNNTSYHKSPTEETTDDDDDVEMNDFDITAKVIGSGRRQQKTKTSPDDEEDEIRYGSKDDDDDSASSFENSSPPGNRYSLSRKKQKKTFASKKNKTSDDFSTDENEFE